MRSEYLNSPGHQGLHWIVIAQQGREQYLSRVRGTQSEQLQHYCMLSCRLEPTNLLNRYNLPNRLVTQTVYKMKFQCSPCLKLKPISNSVKSGFVSVNVEPYGGGLWHTWFDRDLSVAGRVLVRKGEHLVQRLVSFQMLCCAEYLSLTSKNTPFGHHCPFVSVHQWGADSIRKGGLSGPHDGTVSAQTSSARHHDPNLPCSASRPLQ